MDKEIITLNRAEMKKALVIDKLIAHLMTTSEAADSLGITTRQVLRLKDKVVKQGWMTASDCKTCGDRLYRTVNGGATWTKVTLPKQTMRHGFRDATAELRSPKAQASSLSPSPSHQSA